MSEPAAKIYAVPDLKAKLRSQYGLRLMLSGLVAFVLGLVSYLSYNWFVYSQTHLETNNAYIEGDIYHIQSRMMGFTKEIIVDEDDEVKAGDLLLTLDDTDINVEQGFKAAKLKKATADYERGKSLVKSKLISVSDFELIEAGLAAATADSNGTELKLKYTKVTAPTDGVIAKSYIKAGQFIQPGQNLFTLVSRKRFWIKANYKETQIQKIKPGQLVEIEVDAYPGVAFNGSVEGIYPSSGAVTSLMPPENATGNFTKVVQRVPIKIAIEPKEGYELRPGMSVVTTIDLAKKSRKLAQDEKHGGE